MGRLAIGIMNRLEAKEVGTHLIHFLFPLKNCSPIIVSRLN